MDVEGSGIASIGAWLAYLERVNEEKNKKKSNSGVKWLKNLLTTLEAGAKEAAAEGELGSAANDVDDLGETEAERDARLGPHATQVEYARLVYEEVALLGGDGGKLDKEELVEAHGGDFKLFEQAINFPCSMRCLLNLRLP